MIIVDAHTHRSGEALAGMPGFGPREFLRLMDANGITKSWVFTMDGLYFDPVPHNDALKDFCAADSERLIPFCTVHPRYPNAIAELRRCVLELGMKGVKMHPWAQSFSPLEPSMDDLGEEMEGLRVPVEFHDGTPPNSTPLQIAHFAMRHPHLTVILGHGGLHDLWKEAVFAAARCPNIYIVPSSMPLHGLRQAVNHLSIDRFLFGSDGGFGDSYWQAFQLNKIRSLGLGSKEESLILGGNAERVLNGG